MYTLLFSSNLIKIASTSEVAGYSDITKISRLCTSVSNGLPRNTTIYDSIIPFWSTIGGGRNVSCIFVDWIGSTEIF